MEQIIVALQKYIPSLVESSFQRQTPSSTVMSLSPIEKLRHQCLQRGAHGIKGLARQFRIMDDSGDKKLDREEFTKGLQDFKVFLSPAEVDALFKELDRDGNGTISFNEFLQALRVRGEGGVHSRGRPNLVGTAQALLNIARRKTRALQAGPRCRRHVWSASRRRSTRWTSRRRGSSRSTDLKGVYNARQHPKYQNGELTEDQVFLLFLKNFDSPNDPDGKVTIEEFVNYYAGVSASIDTDAYFDLMMRNAWKI
ncbi:hypothetical protein HPB48_027059 [Haemaphysalis longicornis]|uniref:EF-hand domain-containing protein n=1 Tax=Haemaphysalis longicornis TaxID=44386 RepID=A0A9J6H2Y4_HAELO|nr:hypothetical protein HPB48_027059 [Haemaphysalis longicornis]